MFSTVITFFHVGICIFLVLIVLLQQGKGADMGATFGGGGNTLFGASGADNLLTKVTTTVAILFMATSLVLAIQSKPGTGAQGSLFKTAPQSTAQPVSTLNSEVEPPATQESAPSTEATTVAPVPAADSPKAATPDETEK